MNPEPMDRDDVESLLAARQELGAGMEPALVDSFAEKIISEVRRQTSTRHQMVERSQPGNGPQLALGIVSLVMAIPLTAISLAYGFPWMSIVCWIGIVMVNYAFASRRRGQS
ncbi:hypothetical protein [Tessaracoccus sp.]